MFAMDIPNVPPQNLPVMIAQVNQAQPSDVKTMRAIGVCHPAPNELYSGENMINPIAEAMEYSYLYEHKKIAGPATVTVLANPKHGTLRLVTEADRGTLFDSSAGPVQQNDGLYAYLPEKGYVGKDKAVFLVEMAGVKVKVIYFFQAIDAGRGDVDELCGKKGYHWKISSTLDANGNIRTPTNDPIMLATSTPIMASGPTMRDASTTSSGVRDHTQMQYDAVYSSCQDVVPADHVDFLVANQLLPAAAWPHYFHSRDIPFDLSESSHIVLVDQPKHGEVTESYFYRPNKGYLGIDQMVFFVEVKEKVFKVIYSVHVGNMAPEYGACPDYGVKELPNPIKGRDKGGTLDILELPTDGSVDIETQETPFVLVQAATPGGGSATQQPDYILKECQETASMGDPRSAMRVVDPAGMLRNYIQNRDDHYVDLAAIRKIALLEGTKHGKITAGVDTEGFTAYGYDPVPEYIGKDRASFMAEFEGKRYKIVVDLIVSLDVDEHSPQCPDPQLIKVKKPASNSSGSTLFVRPVAS